jgi:hypothetical protein
MKFPIFLCLKRTDFRISSLAILLENLTTSPFSHTPPIQTFLTFVYANNHGLQAMDRFLAAVRHGEILGDKPTVQEIYEEGAASVSEADRDGIITLALAAYLGRSINNCYDDKVRTL